MADFDEYAYLEQQVSTKPVSDGNKSEEKHSKPKEERVDKHKDKDKDTHKDKGSDRDRGRERDKERGSRSRSKSHKRRSRSRSRSRRRRSRSRSRDRRHHRRSRSPPRRRERTPPEVRLANEKERELRELERATRTIFCYQLNLRADEKDLFEFFSQVGTITDIKLITDRHTRKSKGMAYIEFAQQEDAFRAVALNGVAQFMNLPLCVKSAEAEKNLAWEVQQQVKQTQATLQQAAATGPCKLQVLNLHPDLTELDIRPLFEPFGPIINIQVVRDPATGASLKYGYITFSNTADGERAAQHWSGQGLRDNVLAVSIANQLDGPGAAASHEVDLNEEENLKLSAQARALLMSRLAGSAGFQAPRQPTTPPPFPGAQATPPQALPPPPAQALPPPPAQILVPPPASILVPPPASILVPPPAHILAPPPPAVDAAVLLEQGLLGPASPIPTQCLLLKNMFGPQELAEPDAEKEIASDVVEECSKFGNVAHCFVDKASKGFVYLKFETQEAAQAAAQALHGRWYSGHQIVAEFQFTQIYGAYFKV